MHSTLSPFLTKFRTDGLEPGEFVGLASTFGGEPDSYGDIVVHGAFSKSLATHKAKGTRPALLWGHDMLTPIGTWLDVKETSVGLEVRGRLTLEVAKAKEAHALMRDEALALSIGYRVNPNGSHFKDGIQYLKDVELLEVSTVAVPANTNARITQVKSLHNSPQDFERTVRDVLGLSARQAKRLCAGGWSAMVRDEPSVMTEPNLLAIAEQLQSITKSLRQS